MARFNWNRIKRLQRMEENGFEYVLAGLFDRTTLTQDARPSLTSPPSNNRRGAPLIAAAPILAGNPPPTRDDILADAAMLFAISSVRYRGKWSTEHDPADVPGHLRRLLSDDQFNIATHTITTGQSWRARTDVPRMFFREAMKLLFIAKQIRTLGEPIEHGPFGAAAWLEAQPGWERETSVAAEALAAYGLARIAAREIATVKQKRRTSPDVVVERRSIDFAPKPKVVADSQITRAELTKRTRLSQQ